MEAQIVVVGLNHKAAGVAVRERLAFAPAQQEAALVALRRRAAEGVILSTCNRMEVYAVVAAGEASVQEIVDFLAEFHGLAPELFASYLYTQRGLEAVGHLFAVAAGLDSMILGEPQILGQVRTAYEVAAAHGAVGPVLSRAFHQALKAGKWVRTDTDIARSAVSLSHAAVELARKIFGELGQCTALLVGAGKMGELAARNLQDNGLTNVMVTNRTHARGVELAERFGGIAIEFARLAEAIDRADVVITSAGAPDFVLTEPLVRQAMRRRRRRPLFLIDIAVPRNVDPRVQQIEDVFLYNIDDLQAVCAANLAERRKEVAKAQQMIDAELSTFQAWWSSLQVVPTISALRQRAEEIRRAELQKALSRLGNLSEPQRSALEALTLGIVNKLLHQPTIRLKSCCDKDGGSLYVQTLRELFALDEG